MIKIVSITLFLIGYIIISQEHILKVSKTAVSLILGVLLWLLILIFVPFNAAQVLIETSGEIFELVIFLLSAMTLVEIITHYGLFDLIYIKIFNMRLQAKMQFFTISTLAFLFSTFINNLTTTIVFLYIAQRLFKGKNLVKAAAVIVIAANAGGVFSPIGDVTTTMLWMADKYSAQTIAVQGFLPSFTAFLVSALLIGRSIKGEIPRKPESEILIQPVEWIIIGMCCLSFFLPLLMTMIGLPPYMGLLLGLGIVWLTVDIVKPHIKQSSALDLSIETFFQKTDIASLNFFIGILLAISALRYLGILHDLSTIIFTNSPSTMKIISGNILLGGISAIFDNIPLTAAAVDIVKTTDPGLWVMLAYCVGFGGSLLLIGSGSGIIAMTIVKELTFTKYFKIATIPVFIAYCSGIIVWYIQNLLIY